RAAERARGDDELARGGEAGLDVAHAHRRDGGPDQLGDPGHERRRFAGPHRLLYVEVVVVGGVDPGVERGERRAIGDGPLLRAEVRFRVPIVAGEEAAVDAVDAPALAGPGEGRLERAALDPRRLAAAAEDPGSDVRERDLHREALQAIVVEAAVPRRRELQRPV